MAREALHEGNDHRQEAIQEAIEVKKALQELATIKTAAFHVTGNEDSPTIELPIDGEWREDMRVARVWVIKVMEYAGAFLSAERLRKQIGEKRNDIRIGVNDFIVDSKFTPHNYIRIILSSVGRDPDALERSEELGYIPQLYLGANTDDPFVDFAGFLVILLLDYLDYLGGGRGPENKLREAAIAEIHTALSFLIDQDTVIKDERGLGWGFIPSNKYEDASEARHVLPTSWALAAIIRARARAKNQDISDFQLDDSFIKRCDEEIFPGALSWIASLNDEKAKKFWWAGDSRSPRNDLHLCGQLYITEALFGLAEYGVTTGEGPKALDSSRLARESFSLMRDLLCGEGREEEYANFEDDLDYTIINRGGRKNTYTDHTTWPTCLSTVAYGASVLQSEGLDAETLADTRDCCSWMKDEIITSRRLPESSLWQTKTDNKKSLQFHWTMTAVEALMRYVLFVEVEKLSLTADDVVHAVRYALKQKEVNDAIRVSVLDYFRSQRSGSRRG